MKRMLVLFFFFLSISVFAQLPYIDYETVGNGPDWSWTVFSQGTNGMYGVVANPNPGGIDVSDSVAMLVVDTDGDPWAGVWSDSLPDFTLDNTNSIITIMVYKDHTSRFNLKLEPPNVDHFDSNTVVNQWQQLTFDYSSDIGVTATRLTVIPDQPDEYPRSYGSTNYWDNIDFSGTVVPVELTSFTGAYVGNAVQLKWSTATELNNKGFDVQRSIAGSKFVTVGFVQGKGTTTESNSYSFVDKSISPNTIYSYRLKQIDLDGSFNFAGVVNLGRSLPLNFELSQNYPNPFNPTTKVNVSLPINSNVSLDVYNIVGEKVMTVVNGNLDAGNYDYTIDGSKLSSGIYVYRLVVAGENGANFTATKKMTLLK